MKTFDILAKTLFGMENILASEIEKIGGTHIRILNRAVKYQGNTEVMYRSNLELRTALKILKPITWFEAHNEQQLYDRVKDIKWEHYLRANQTFAIDAVTQSQVFNHSHYAALKTKDAIADRFRAKFDKRPSVDTETPDLRINLHISDKTCTLSLDSTGPSLDKRGYRLERTTAPINEVLAAGIILMSGWDGKSDFYDPMCGSGTFSIEAALMSANIPIGNLRRFAFEWWNDFDAAVWGRVQENAKRKQRPCEANIYCRDNDAEAIEIAKANATRAEVADAIQFSQADFFASSALAESGWIFLNPPYGERLEQDEIIAFYKEIGSRCKQHYVGCQAWIISSHKEAMKFFGLKPAFKTMLFNGALECKLHSYEFYKGSREKQKSEGL